MARTSTDSTQPAARDRSGILDRVLAIIELLASNTQGLPLHEIAARLDIPRSAAHRLLNDLIEQGYVCQDGDRGDYMLTAKLVSLSFTYLSGCGVVDLAQPILDRLALKTGELVRLSVVDTDRLTWVAKAQGARTGLRYDPDMGMEAPLYCTASGFAWLSCLPDDEAMALIERQRARIPDHDEGPNRPRSDAEILEHLHQTRQRGYSMTIETFAAGMNAMAAPVRRRDTGQVKGAISVAGPHVRVSEQRLHDMAPDLLAAAAELAATGLGSPAFSRPRRDRDGADIFIGPTP
ncbi:DNA-binding IclR family transcriptional regulator [Azospirillum fermentarium]|uniref:IclR family transcriptional regulator n=1 Tax=Azospirillum fermentarium TaxID=1233114 RepID=UPI002225F3DC|nr:IclR family transcriptional regulator [Azospirillum fermentarium]MCW2248111.1 DNA-binding IclR family transcriptional regulator [Azospirillum fermentarium]